MTMQEKISLKKNTNKQKNPTCQQILEISVVLLKEK